MRKRLLRAALLATTTLATPGLAQADPISLTALAATAAGTALTSATTAALGATLAGILGAVLTAAIGFAGQMLFGRNQTSSGQRDSRTREFDPHPTFMFAFGEFPQEGRVVFHHAKGQQYYMTILLSSVPSDAACIEWIEINDGIRLEIAGLNGVETAFGVDNDIYDMTKGARVTGSNAKPGKPGPYGVNSTPELIFWVGTGEQAAPPSLWTSEIPDVIEATDTWKGATVCHVRISYGNNKQAARRWTHGKPPPFRFFGKWAKLYDPRLDPASGVTQFGTISPGGTHDPDDRTTWEWSANPALAALMLARHDFALGFDDEMIPIQQYADAADACEVEDGGVSEVTLHEKDWTSTAPVAHVAGTDHGAGVWAYSRGSVQLATGTFGATDGLPIVRIHSTDTNGTLADDELGRIGVYIDMLDEGRRGDIEYLLTLSGGAHASPNGNGKRRLKVYTANRDASNGISAAQQAASLLPPSADAATFTLAYDSGVASVGTNFPGIGNILVEGELVSFVFEAGEPNENFVEFGETSLSTTSQAGKSRFRCDGLIVIDERELSLLDPVLSSMAGHLDTTDGLLGIRAGVWVAPVDTLSQPVGDDIEVRGARDAGFDTVRAKFIGRHREWEETDGPGYALRAGARVHPLQLALVREPEQAARLEKIAALRAEPNRVITATWDGRELNRRLGQRVNASLPGFGRAGGTFVIESKTPVTQEVDDGFEVAARLTLIEDLEATYAWSSADYEESEASTPPAQVSPDLDPPTSVDAVQENYTIGGDTAARIRITITVSSEVASAADKIRVEITDDTGYTFLADIEVVSDPVTTTYTAWLNPAVVRTTYTARARAESDALGVSDYTVSNSVTITEPVRAFTDDFTEAFV